MELCIRPGGVVVAIHDDKLDLRAVGNVTIKRVSHVEPTPEGDWTADMSPVNGPVLGPFPTRGAALAAELEWLRMNNTIASFGGDK